MAPSRVTGQEYIRQKTGTITGPGTRDRISIAAEPAVHLYHHKALWEANYIVPRTRAASLRVVVSRQ